MDAIALLTADHNRVRGLFARFSAAKETKDPVELDALGAEIFTELSVHTAIEEDRFYPWASGLSDEIKETVDEGIQEHHVVKVLMAEIADLSPGEDEWVAKMTVLIENVEHHATEEEDELFPSIRTATTAQDLTDMADLLEAEKAELGAPVLADKIDLTSAELHDLASAQEIPGRSSMDHDELAATVAPPTA